MAKIDTLFMSKTAEKPYPLGPHIPIQPILGSTPPGGHLKQTVADGAMNKFGDNNKGG